MLRERISQEVPERKSPVHSILEELMLQGIRYMIEKALAMEIEDKIGCQRYERQGKKRRTGLYRNGYQDKRSLSTLVGRVELTVPRLRERFVSQILPRYQRKTAQLGALFPQLYLHGLSLLDFEACFSSLLGENAPLSPTSICRLKQSWQKDFSAWKNRPLEEDYLYVWADGIYPKAGPKDESFCLLVVLGVNRQGEKHLLALQPGYRESFQSWKDLFLDIQERGVQWIGLLIADGIKGIDQALRDVFPTTARQLCFVHKIRNILDKVPLKAHDQVLTSLHKIYYASSKQEALRCKKAFIQTFHSLYPQAVNSLSHAKDSLFAFFSFPQQHWRSIKSTNPLESIFMPIKKRTSVAQRIPNRNSALLLVFQLVHYQQSRLHKIKYYKIIPQTIERMKKTILPLKPSKSNVAA